jgi:hypothetical protein
VPGEHAFVSIVTEYSILLPTASALTVHATWSSSTIALLDDATTPAQSGRAERVNAFETVSTRIQ